MGSHLETIKTFTPKEKLRGREKKEERNEAICEFDVPHHYAAANDFFHLVPPFDKGLVCERTRMQD